MSANLERHRATTEPAIGFKKTLSGGFQFQWKHIAGYDHHVSSVERSQQFFQPLRRHRDIVIGGNQNISVAAAEPFVACVGQSSARLVYQPYAGEFSDDGGS